MALPPPPDTNAWEQAITESVEALIVSVGELKHQMDILIDQARLRIISDKALKEIDHLDEAIQVVPIKRARTCNSPSVSVVTQCSEEQ